VDHPGRKPRRIQTESDVPTIGAIHDAWGTIIRVTESSWAIDFGVPAFQQSTAPKWAKVGGGVRELKDEPGMPDLFREWTVRRILLETTPWNTPPTLRK
jgi:hypothetical protein